MAFRARASAIQDKWAKDSKPLYRMEMEWSARHFTMRTFLWNWNSFSCIRKHCGGKWHTNSLTHSSIEVFKLNWPLSNSNRHVSFRSGIKLPIFNCCKFAICNATKLRKFNFMCFARALVRTKMSGKEQQPLNCVDDRWRLFFSLSFRALPILLHTCTQRNSHWKLFCLCQKVFLTHFSPLSFTV